MEETVTPRNRGISALALAGALAALGVACLAMPTAAAQADEAGGDYRPSDWAESSEAVSSADIPTLTNDVGRPEGHAGSQLPLGLGLLAVGLVGLACGLAGMLTRRLGSRPTSRSADAAYRLAKRAHS